MFSLQARHARASAAQVGGRPGIPCGMMPGMKRDEYQIVTRQEVEVPGCLSLLVFTVILVGLGLWGLFGMLQAQLGFGYNSPAEEAAGQQASSLMWLCGAFLVGGWVAYLKGAREVFRPKVLLAVLALLWAVYVADGMKYRALIEAERARAEDGGSPQDGTP